MPAVSPCSLRSEPVPTCSTSGLMRSLKPARLSSSLWAYCHLTGCMALSSWVRWVPRLLRTQAAEACHHNLSWGCQFLS